MDLDEHQTTYLLYAPAKNPGGWNLDLAAFGAALEATFPEVRYETRQGGQLRLSFWAVSEDGIEFTGFASNEGRDTVVLTDNTADEAAVFIAWLRDSFLPSPDLVRFSSEPAQTEIRELLAYAREFHGDRRYKREPLAEASGRSVSGIRTAYKDGEADAVTLQVGREPAGRRMRPPARHGHDRRNTPASVPESGTEAGVFRR
ncbi:hypothetical protein [Streptomyces sp. Ag109_G2-15]|uniref:hypothetical protein n=1 Tax=Streptomyces sp. Ag109_G2-15 TaxID=1938850 RepID=UPI000BCEE73C|nr:hypothetical protein [Streptomyces sp. Ag109_G2-15]SOD91555.1 hypothetical protein SAMN06272765_7209 [Streptomyces sp. Ag109_G2-15]